MEEEQEFQVRDRRSHLSEGDAEGEASSKTIGDGPSPQEERPPQEETFPVNFASFILSLATSALIHLGEEANPATGQTSVQLSQARQAIDLIALLEGKTKGNLTKEEEGLISQILFTLRMKFVEREKKPLH